VDTPAAAQPASGESGEVVVLSPFEVSEKKDNPYQSRQALSASRVATEIQDIPQTISVVTSELLRDSMGARMLDAAKYVTPITESTLPFGGDRYTIRGFAVSHEFIDGMEISGADGYSMSIAPYNIERIEVLKGPNTILVPGGSPGGQMNPITKSPFGRDASSMTVELAQYNGNAVSFDVNKVLNSKTYSRMIAAFWYNDSLYIKDQFRHGYMLAPSVSYQITADHKLTVKAEIVDNHETNLAGVPLDPSVGSEDVAKIARGLPRNWMFGNDDDERHRQTQRLSGELLSNFGDHVSSRLMVAGDHIRRVDIGGTGAAVSSAGGGSVNPFTGLYEPGINWNTTDYNNDKTGTVVLTGTPVAVTAPSTWTYTRSNGKVDLEYTEAHIKNDYSIKFDTSWVKSTTITGLSANYSKVHFQSFKPVSRGAVAANALDSITFPEYVFPDILPGLTTAALGTDKTGVQKDLQLFVLETLGFFKDRLQVSGGVSRFFGTLERTDHTGTAIDPTLLTNNPRYDLTDNATSFGMVVKPIQSVSLFFNRNTTGGTMPGSLQAGNVSPTIRLAQGSQKEYGVKTTQLNGRLTASLAYFDIAQQNYAVTNSEYYNLVAQGKLAEAAALPPLYLNLKSRGWEFETSYAITANLMIMGNYTNYQVRQPFTNVRVRGVPDRAYALYADYNFSDGVLKGFGVNVGIDYKDKCAGDNATGYTTSRLLPNGTMVAKQPQFMVDERVLVNLGFSYKHDNWVLRMQIANLLDEDYVLAAGSRSSVVIGEPINVKGSFTWNF
jgi:iron complex outermembrane receptor protein